VSIITCGRFTQSFAGCTAFKLFFSATFVKTLSVISSTCPPKEIGFSVSTTVQTVQRLLKRHALVDLFLVMMNGGYRDMVATAALI
jgi:hypothetical protein